MSDDHPFELEPEHVVDQAPKLFDLGTSATSAKISARTEASRRRAIARVTKMQASHGPGPEGQTCGHCRHLVNHYSNVPRRFFKCELYGISRSEASDWRKGWPACGRFTLKPEALEEGRPISQRAPGRPRGSQEIGRIGGRRK